MYRIVNNKIFTFFCKTVNISKKYLKIKQKNISILKLGHKKIYLINLQRNSFRYDMKIIETLHRFLKNNKIEPIAFDGSIYWNRYSILDETGKLKNILNKLDIEASNFSWPKPLHILYENHQNVSSYFDLEKSEHASKYIINIPVWINCFNHK